MCRFECRWATVAIKEGSPAIMLKGMGGSRVGVWCAHGEGRVKFPDAAVQQDVLSHGLAPIRFATSRLRVALLFHARCCGWPSIPVQCGTKLQAICLFEAVNAALVSDR